MTSGIFITGTDTGVGKTHIGSGIVRALVARGIDIGVMKPAETGCEKRHGRLIPRDAMRLMRAANVSDDLALVNPYRSRFPLAPAVAAKQEGSVIRLPLIHAAYRSLAKRHRFLVVEGAGGILVPLTDRITYLDLAERFHLPVLIVARPNLGTINHTVLTVRAIQSKDISIAGIVLNDSLGSKRGLAERTNADVITRLTGIPVIAEVRYGQRDLSGLVRRLLSSKPYRYLVK